MIDANAKPTKIIRVTNKKNGVTYLYEDQAFWNSEKKRGEHKRKCIGRLGPDGNEISLASAFFNTQTRNPVF